MVLEPFGDYTVFDAILDRPAEMGDHVFIGLAQEDATHACRALNALHGADTEAQENTTHMILRAG